MGICFLEKNFLEYQKYLSFLLSKPNYFTMFAMEDPVNNFLKNPIKNALFCGNTALCLPKLSSNEVNRA